MLGSFVTSPKFPVLIPVSRELRGEWFACDCVLRHSVYRFVSVPLGSRQSLLWPQFLTPCGGFCAEGTLPANSNKPTQVDRKHFGTTPTNLIELLICFSFESSLRGERFHVLIAGVADKP
jgi:hypothetical protein